MHSQITGEFSSVGLEHLPYKQRVGGSNPSTPTLIKALSQDGAFFVSGRFEFTQKKTEMKKGPPERSEGVLLSTARRDNGICNPSTPTLIYVLFATIFTPNEFTEICLLTNQGIEPRRIPHPDS